MNRLKTFCLALLCFPSLLICHTPSHQFYIGPEIYHVRLTRGGGAHQDGMLYGGRLGYDRIKRYGWYWGVDALYATGELTGKNGGGHRIKSNFTDTSVEGRFGYTFKCKTGYRPSFTPFIGAGYFVQRNNFKHPSPIPAHFRTTFAYGTAGFLSQISINPCWDIGVNFKVRYPYDPKCHISHDPEVDNSTQTIAEKIQYRVELPVTYHTGYCCDRVLVSCVPFYEYRHFGEHPNYPFDFYDTKFNNYGLLIKFMYCL